MKNTLLTSAAAGAILATGLASTAMADGHATDLDSIAEDVSAFLMWTAEPKLNARKEAGLTGVVFLAILSVLLYLTNKRLWAPHKGKKET